MVPIESSAKADKLVVDRNVLENELSTTIENSRKLLFSLIYKYRRLNSVKHLYENMTNMAGLPSNVNLLDHFSSVEIGDIDRITSMVISWVQGPGKSNELLHRECIVHIDSIQNAISDLVQNNINFVKFIVRRYSISWVDEMDDLLQDGYLGLVIAAGRFQPNAGSFRTYAKFWIEACVKRSSRVRRNIVSIPDTTMGVLESVSNARNNNVNASVSEIAAKLSIKEDRVIELLETPNNRYDPESSIFWECFIDHAKPADVVAIESETYRFIDATLALLTPKEEYILRKHSEGLSLHDIGKEFNVSRERIRQIEIKALAKIKKRVNNNIYEELK